MKQLLPAIDGVGRSFGNARWLIGVIRQFGYQ
jgi:hypothetical protein